MGLFDLFKSIEDTIISRKIKREESEEISALVSTIAQLKKEKSSVTETMNHYWKLYTDLKKEVESGEYVSPNNGPLLIQSYIASHSISYSIEENDEYIRLYSQEEGATISFRREFNKSKDNHNWVDKDHALITLVLDNFNYKMLNPTIVKAPASGIFECDKNKIIQFGEEICRIKKYDPESKEKIINKLERQAIKDAVLKKELKKMIERETLDELIAEGKVFNVAITKEGHRVQVPLDIASAVWNRDGGQCCICGSKKS